MPETSALDALLTELADELEAALDVVADPAVIERFAEIIARCQAAKALAVRGHAMTTE